MKPKNWEVEVTFRGKVVERRTGMTRFGARMEASGLNSTFARGMRVVQRGGLFTAPVYEGGAPYAFARESQLAAGSSPENENEATDG